MPQLIIPTLVWQRQPDPWDSVLCQHSLVDRVGKWSTPFQNTWWYLLRNNIQGWLLFFTKTDRQSDRHMCTSLHLCVWLYTGVQPRGYLQEHVGGDSGKLYPRNPCSHVQQSLLLGDCCSQDWGEANILNLYISSASWVFWVVSFPPGGNDLTWIEDILRHYVCNK